MSDTTPEPAPKPNAGSDAEAPSNGDTAGNVQDTGAAAPAPATSPAESAAAESAAAEPRDADPDMANPPSSPVSARGHVNRPADEAAEPAGAAAAAPAPAPAPARTIEPEPVVATDDDVAAAVARSADPAGQPGATAAGSASVDTASPAQSATPVIAAAEAANLQTQAEAQTQQPAPAAPAATAAYATAPTGEATWAPEPAATQTAPQQPGPQAVAPIFLQRPEPPKKKSNRGVGILIALVGTVAFALLWVVAIVLIGALITPGNELLSTLRDYFTAHYSGWVPVVAFFIGMVVLIQIVNRARWWAYILGGLFVAVFVYLAYVGADLIDLRYWARTPGERAILLGTVWPNPFAVVAGVLAREISIWTGAWLAARGRKLKARNAEAQADYEQQLADAQNQAAAAYVQQGY